MPGNIYRPGDHYVICDECGFQMRSSEVMKRWDGMIVCRKDWELRHPQDGVRAVHDRQRVANPRPVPADVFVNPGDITEAGL